MPYVSVHVGPRTTRFTSSAKSFVFFRNVRPDAVDPVTGERHDDVTVFWVLDESDKQAMVQDANAPYFTRQHPS